MNQQCKAFLKQTVNKKMSFLLTAAIVLAGLTACSTDPDPKLPELLEATLQSVEKGTTGNNLDIVFTSARPDDEELTAFFQKMEVGEIIEGTVQAGNTNVNLKACRGDHLYSLVLGNFERIIYEDNAFRPRPFQVSHKTLDDYIEEGGIVPEISGDAYTLENIYDSQNELSYLIYRTPTNRLIQVYIDKGDVSLDSASDQEPSAHNVTIDDRVFAVEESPDVPDQPDLVSIDYFIDGNAAAINLNNVDVHSSSWASEEEMLDAAKHLVVHNETASTVPVQYYDETFFLNSSDAEIQKNAQEIMQGIKDSMASAEPIQVVWTGNGREVSVMKAQKDIVDSIIIEYQDISYNEMEQMFAEPFTKNPYMKEEWMDVDRYRSASVNYYRGKLNMITLSGASVRNNLLIEIFPQGSKTNTPLDLLALRLKQTGNDLEFIEKPSALYLISKRAPYNERPASHLINAVVDEEDTAYLYHVEYTT